MVAIGMRGRVHGSLAVLAGMAGAAVACTRTAAPIAPVTTVASTRVGSSTGTGQVVATARPDQRAMVLATTTSTQDSGLLDVIVPLFERLSSYQVKTVSVGTGAALQLGARGEADVVLVHAPDAEKDWMAQGYGTERILVMHNDFVVTGPPADPAKIKGLTSALEALRRVAQASALWVSRDDNSGTDNLEKQLWKDAGVEPKGQTWYITSGQGMGATLTLADQKDAYTISDRATYLSRKGSVQATVLVEGDPKLLNVYHVMPVNPAKFPSVSLNVAGGQAFARFLVLPDTQRVIGDFGKDKYGQALFFADAGKPEPV
jgi:tungstate transport system substrate-binding protein